MKKLYFWDVKSGVIFYDVFTSTEIAERKTNEITETIGLELVGMDYMVNGTVVRWNGITYGVDFNSCKQIELEFNKLECLI